MAQFYSGKNILKANSGLGLLQNSLTSNFNSKFNELYNIDSFLKKSIINFNSLSAINTKNKKVNYWKNLNSNKNTLISESPFQPGYYYDNNINKKVVSFSKEAEFGRFLKGNFSPIGSRFTISMFLKFDKKQLKYLEFDNIITIGSGRPFETLSIGRWQRDDSLFDNSCFISSGHDSFRSFTPLPFRQWFLLTLECNNNLFSLYINNKKIEIEQPYDFFNLNGDICLGKYPFMNTQFPFFGSISNVIIFDKILKKSEKNKLFQYFNVNDSI